jgi:quinol monooxygenase YgiN
MQCAQLGHISENHRREKAIFARVVECQAKEGRGVQISTKVTNEVLPILQKQPGFVDFLALSDKTNAERLVCISFWTSREDAEEYHQNSRGLLRLRVCRLRDSEVRDAWVGDRSHQKGRI